MHAYCMENVLNKREIHIYKGFSVECDGQKNCICNLKKDKTTKIKPFQFNLDDIQKIFPIVIRVYRLFFALLFYMRIFSTAKAVNIYQLYPYFQFGMINAFICVSIRPAITQMKVCRIKNYILIEY